MSIDRATIFDALFALISGIPQPPGVPPIWFGRRIQKSDEMQLPSVILKSFGEMDSRPHWATPNTVTLMANVYIYTRDSADANGDPDTQLFQILGAIEDALVVPPFPGYGRQTLRFDNSGRDVYGRDLVNDTWISGRVTQFSANLQEVSITVVAIDMLATL